MFDVEDSESKRTRVEDGGLCKKVVEEVKLDEEAERVEVHLLSVECAGSLDHKV